MDNLEPYPGFYDNRGYGDGEKYFLHHTTVCIYFYYSQVIYLSNIFYLNINKIFVLNYYFILLIKS